MSEEFIGLVQLNNGTNLIAKIDQNESSKKGIRLQRPYVVIINPSGDAGVADWLILAEEDNVTIPVDIVTYVLTPKKQLASGYKKTVWGEKQIIEPTNRIVLPE